jgi:hypothetical protein
MNKVAIIMGSKSDFDIMSEAIEILKSFGIKTEHDIVSAHRTPNKMIEYAENAELNGIKGYYCRCWRCSSSARNGSFNHKPSSYWCSYKI